MVTSSARIILAAAGGDDKKAKTEISLLAPGTSWRGTSDAKGVIAWCVDAVSSLSPPPFLLLTRNLTDVTKIAGQTLYV
jgi:hypothetical protein